MTSLYRILVSLSLCLSPIFGSGQAALTSTLNEYNKTKPQTAARFEVAGRYAQSLFFDNQSVESLRVLEENMKDAVDLGMYQYAAYFSAVLAIQHRILGGKEEVAQHLKQGSIYAAQTSDQETKGYVLYAKGWIQTRDDLEIDAVRSFQQAVNAYQQALQTEQVYGRLNSVYKELAAIYLNWRELELYNKYVELTLETAKKQRDPMRLFDAYMLMGYSSEQRFHRDAFDTISRNQAEHYYKIAISTYQTNQNMAVAPSDLAYAAVNLANLYLQAYPANYQDEASRYAKLALKVATETQQYNLVASANGILSELAERNNNLADTKAHLMAALSALESESMVDNSTTVTLFLKLSEIHEDEGDYQQAIHYYKQYINAYERVFDSEKVEQSKRLEAQFDKERQDQQLIRMRLEGDKKEQQISLMQALAGQQEQELQNFKLREENQKQELEVVQLEANRRNQELQLSRLESRHHAQELYNSQKELRYQSKLNTVYALLAVAFFLSILLLLYAYRQRSQSLRQAKEVHDLELEQERQHSHISNLTAMLQGQETERARLARDLHDGLGGLLSGTKIGLSRAVETKEKNLEKEVNKSISQLDVAVDELRRVAHNLMPELLVKYGLKTALHEYARRMSTTNLELCAQFVNVQSELDEKRQIVVYRIIQELVNNAVKHAQASQILIQLTENNHHIHVTVEDNGKGFDKQVLDGKNTAGMHNIASRLGFLGGKMHIDSQPNLGTTVEFEFPSKY